jgi:hypothetical protein
MHLQARSIWPTTGGDGAATAGHMTCGGQALQMAPNLGIGACYTDQPLCYAASATPWGSVFRTGNNRQNLAKCLDLLATPLRGVTRNVWRYLGTRAMVAPKICQSRQGVAKPLQSENGPEGSQEPKLKKQGFDWSSWELKSKKQKSHVSQHAAQEFRVYDLHIFQLLGPSPNILGCRQTFWR